MTRAALLLLVAGTAALAQLTGMSFGPSWVDGPESRGERVALRVDPADLFENIGSRVDGAGMCVDTSIETMARGLGMDQWRGYRDYFARTERGGNYPEGVDRQLAKYAKLKGLGEPRYVQYTGPDPIPVLELAEKTGRGCCIAYGYSPRYGEAINHMVFCPHPRGAKYAAITDNNIFGGLARDEAHRYEWMDRDELVHRMKTQAGSFGRAVPCDAWVFVWLEPPPPPSPKLFPPE